MRRNRVVVMMAVLVLAAAGPLAAQEYNQRLVAQEAGRLGIALCPLRYSGKLNDANKQLKTGVEDADALKRGEALVKAEQIVRAAMVAGDDANPASWYILGRTALARGDLRGTDTAFTRTEAMMPDCEVDISQRRQAAWAVLANAGIEKQAAGDVDSAIVLLRDATIIFRALPHVFENLGIMFANKGLTDSAVVYFEMAATVAEGDSTLVENRNSATLNLALMLQRSGRQGEAIQIFHRYLTWFPKDKDARRSLVYSFREAGMVDSAEVIERQMVEEFASMDLDSLDFSDAMAVGVSQFNAKQYVESAKVFERLMARNPWSRDAVYNLANAYLALDDKPNLTRAARVLSAIEPLNEDAYRLMGQGYRDRFQDSLIAVAEQLVALPVHVEITSFSLGSTVVKLTGTAVGREPSDPRGNIIPPAAATLVVEFVNAAGGVLASQEVMIPALPTQQQHQFTAEARVEGVAGWRYRLK